MAEKLLNPDFNFGTDDWQNGPEGHGYEGGYPSEIYAYSDPSSTDEWTYCIRQQFTISDLVLTAKMSAWRRWWGEDSSCHVRHRIWLKKPNGDNVVIADEDKAGGSGEGYLVHDLNIAAYMTTQGNYTVTLYCDVHAGAGFAAKGWWHFCNVDVSVKKTKTIFENIKAVEVTTKKAGKHLSEYVICQETLTNKKGKFFSLPIESIMVVEGLKKKITKIIFESVKVVETLFKSSALMKTISEYIFCAESLLKKRIIPRTLQEHIHAVEFLSAKRTHGNMETTYNITEDMIEWEAETPIVTHWRKEKIEII